MLLFPGIARDWSGRPGDVRAPKCGGRARGRGHCQRCASLVVALALTALGVAHAQERDGIDRNLLEREQNEREFHVRLFDDAEKAKQPASPGSTPTAPPVRLPLRSSDAVQLQLLHDSQLRRQLELQNQPTPVLPRDQTLRQQQSDVQQLQFGRENQSQQLQQQIMRDSNAAMRGLR